MALRVVLAGVPGSGKSTTIQLLLKEVPDVTVVNFGDFMLEAAREMYGIENRDDMRKKLSLEEYRKAQIEAARKLARAIEGKEKVIIDTHVAIKTPYGFYPGFPEEVAEIVKPDVFVLLEFDPMVILSRRLKDLHKKGSEVTEVGTIAERREREIEEPRDIELHMQMNRIFAAAAAAKCFATVKVLDFRGIPEPEPFYHAKQAAKELAKIFKENA